MQRESEFSETVANLNSNNKTIVARKTVRDESIFRMNLYPYMTHSQHHSSESVPE